MKSCKFTPVINLDRDSVIPLRAQIVDQLRRNIVRNRLSAGTKIVSERQLADELEVNRNTIHQAYEQLVSEGLLSVSELRGGGMVISPDASGHYRNSFPSLNLILPYRFSEQLKFSNLQGLEIIGAIMDRAAELHISVNIMALPSTDLTRAEAEAWLEDFLPRSIGIITLGLRTHDFNAPFKELLNCRTLPHVFVSGTSPLPHISSVTADVATGAREMLKCLKSFGHKHLGIAAAKTPQLAQFKNSAYERGATIGQQAAAHGFQTTMLDIPFTPGKPVNTGTFVREFLNLKQPPTALWIQNDNIAEQLLPELEAAGLRVPEMLSVIGYDNSCRSYELSTIDHPREEIGTQAVDIIAELFDHGEPGDVLHRKIPSHFILRKSIDTPSQKTVSTQLNKSKVKSR